MNKNKIDKLIVTAQESSFCEQGIAVDSISHLESILQIIFSTDFLYLSASYHFEYLDKFDWAGFESGVKEYTEYYRSKGLPHRYIILADEGDGGIVLMETQDDREKPSPVIWCDYPDIFNLCECGEFKLNPDIWPSFTDFFEYLVEQEEKLQNEELN